MDKLFAIFKDNVQVSDACEKEKDSWFNAFDRKRSPDQYIPPLADVKQLLIAEGYYCEPAICARASDSVVVDKKLFDSVCTLLTHMSFSHETEYDGRTYIICDLCDKQDGEHTDDCLSHTGDKIIEQFLSAKGEI